MTEYERGRQAGLEEAARVADENAEKYPPEVWPEDSQHPESRVAAGCRLASRNIADAIRALASQPTSQRYTLEEIERAVAVAEEPKHGVGYASVTDRFLEAFYGALKEIEGDKGPA